MEPISSDRGYWATDDRLAAEEKAVEFVNAFRRLGVDFDDIEITDPCGTCSRLDHRINVGTISVEEAGEYTRKINRTMDLFDSYRKQIEEADAIAQMLTRTPNPLGSYRKQLEKTVETVQKLSRLVGLLDSSYEQTSDTDQPSD
ncbi:hypothetical protein [Streptomyces catenulae]|uniref:Uncharacterized protein n=1 Tax=Streptomyces catenulae TaxID=66875 RepID=A0ABV2YYG0_9ACTN|nr:hypothetical protein [Streptomyces catenulae]